MRLFPLVDRNLSVQREDGAVDRFRRLESFQQSRKVELERRWYRVTSSQQDVLTGMVLDESTGKGTTGRTKAIREAGGPSNRDRSIVVCRRQKPKGVAGDEAPISNRRESKPLFGFGVRPAWEQKIVDAVAIDVAGKSDRSARARIDQNLADPGETVVGKFDRRVGCRRRERKSARRAVDGIESAGALEYAFRDDVGPGSPDQQVVIAIAVEIGTRRGDQ